MLVKDGAIEKMFVERDGFETIPLVSNAETMLNYISPETKKPDRTMLAA
jgi:glutathione-dependent peroxiredoxin